ncbi:MerR family transcriptional regulator [Azospirillum sp. sgz302134]
MVAAMPVPVFMAVLMVPVFVMPMLAVIVSIGMPVIVPIMIRRVMIMVVVVAALPLVMGVRVVVRHGRLLLLAQAPWRRALPGEDCGSACLPVRRSLRMDPPVTRGSSVMSDKSTLSIGALAKATGTKPETIRFYEQIGILPQPARTAGNYRMYGPDHLRRLTFVRRARELGFPLDTVRAMLALADQPDRPCGEVDAMVVEQLHEVERKIADLQRLREELDRLAHQCRGGGRVADCRIVEALLPGNEGLGTGPDHAGMPAKGA